MRGVLDECAAEVHDEMLSVGRGILSRMRRLNKTTAATIMLREALDMQGKSMAFVHQQARGLWLDFDDLAKDEAQGAFLARCEDVGRALEHYEVLAKGTMEQLQNLLQMMISLEQIAQVQSVGRLNSLAFTFLPLSFVAVRYTPLPPKQLF